MEQIMTATQATAKASNMIQFKKEKFLKEFKEAQVKAMEFYQFSVCLQMNTDGRHHIKDWIRSFFTERGYTVTFKNDRSDEDAIIEWEKPKEA